MKKASGGYHSFTSDPGWHAHTSYLHQTPGACKSQYSTHTNTSGPTITYCIAKPALTSSGGTWASDSKKIITWKMDSLVQRVSIELARDNGKAWTVLFTRTANGGNKQWTVTKPATTQAKLRVVAIDPFRDEATGVTAVSGVFSFK